LPTLKKHLAMLEDLQGREQAAPSS
jgi:hypothetical protein